MSLLNFKKFHLPLFQEGRQRTERKIWMISCNGCEMERMILMTLQMVISKRLISFCRKREGKLLWRGQKILKMPLLGSEIRNQLLKMRICQLHSPKLALFLFPKGRQRKEMMMLTTFLPGLEMGSLMMTVLQRSSKRLIICFLQRKARLQRTGRVISRL